MPAQKTISPVDGSLFAERQLACATDIDAQLDRAREGFARWRRTSLDDRIELVERAMSWLEAHTDELAPEISWQMGRPIRYAPLEVTGTVHRGRSMCELSRTALARITPPQRDGIRRFIEREPVGVVLVLSPWNYPYLTAINAVVPALLAGNSVVIKHSDQTPLCAERLVQAFVESGLPEGVFQYLHMNHDRTARLVADARVDHVAFTGSVAGGRAVVKAASDRFIGVGLELGGKDPAYVRADADLDFAIENTADGAFFNSGQSCCAVERIYVDHRVYDRFVEGFVDVVKRYRLANPLDPETTLGPVVRRRNAEGIRRQTAHAVDRGARALIDEAHFGELGGGAYLAPQVLVDVDHSMPIMTEETFGPVVGIMPVTSDEQAVQLMNDSAYGLTASIWTSDLDRAEQLGRQIETGTVFANRADVLDPELAWVGCKDSGRGCTLSVLGFDAFTRPKSFHLRAR